MPEESDGLSGFVQGADLRTGGGWNEPVSTAIGEVLNNRSEGGRERRGPRSTPRRRQQRDVTRSVVTGLTLNFGDLDLDDSLRMEEDAGIPLREATRAAALAQGADGGNDGNTGVSSVEAQVIAPATPAQAGLDHGAPQTGGGGGETATDAAPPPADVHMTTRRRGRRAGANHQRPIRAPPPPTAPLRILQCLWCSAEAPFTAQNGASLLSHITKQHGGQELGTVHVQQLLQLNK
eukprot:9781732-Karenia_brevis.AAC.1